MFNVLVSYKIAYKENIYIIRFSNIHLKNSGNTVKKTIIVTLYIYVNNICNKSRYQLCTV